MIDWRPQNLENIFSQFGEDSVIKEIFKRLPKSHDRQQICVEFGAWDGIHLSNTANLIRNHSWEGVFIEADRKRFRELQNNYKNFEVKLVNQFVNFEGSGTLNEILNRLDIPKDFDLLSIDIDGADYWILESLQDFKPKAIIIEFNPTIPNSITFINPKDFSVKQGSSLKALIDLGISKGYIPITTTLCNLFLVDNKFQEIFQTQACSIDELHTPTYVNNIWVGFDGTVFLEKDLNMLWHNFTLSAKSLQSLPKYLRVFPEDYSRIQTILFSLRNLIRNSRRHL